MNPLKIERPQITDWDALNDFFKTMIQHTFESNGLSHLTELCQEEIEEKRRLLELDFNTSGEAYYFLVAKEDDLIVGTAAYGPSGKIIQACTHGELDHCPEIGTGFVHHRYQRTGIGSQLTRCICQVLWDKGVREVCWDSGYPMAQKIWTHKFGTPQYVIENYWGDDAPHMIWHLTLDDMFEHLGSSSSNNL